MARRITDIVNEGEALGVVGGAAAGIPVPTAAADVGAAADGDVVKLTGDQTVAGVKTFSSSPVIPAPTTDLQAATKKYVDDNIGGGSAAELGSMLAGIDSRTAFVAQFGADEGYDEEFDGAGVADDTLPTGWSDISMEAAAVYRQWFGAGRVDWGGGGDASNLQIVARSIPATTTFDAMMHLWGAAASEVAAYTCTAVLYNSVNGRVITFGAFNPSTTDKTLDFYVSYYSDVDTSSAAIAGPTVVVPNVGLHGYYWIVKASDASYSFLYSPDGGCFFTVASALDVQSAAWLNGDPTHIGFALNTSAAAHVGCEWLRIRNLT